MGGVSTVPREKVAELCPDCPTLLSVDNEQVKKTLTLSLEKFNKEGGLSKHFALLTFNRALVSVSFHFFLEFLWMLVMKPTVYSPDSPSSSSDLAHQPCYQRWLLPGVCSPVD